MLLIVGFFRVVFTIMAVLFIFLSLSRLTLSSWYVLNNNNNDFEPTSVVNNGPKFYLMYRYRGGGAGTLNVGPMCIKSRVHYLDTASLDNNQQYLDIVLKLCTRYVLLILESLHAF